jgi:hypothetical protein
MSSLDHDTWFKGLLRGGLMNKKLAQEELSWIS